MNQLAHNALPEQAPSAIQAAIEQAEIAEPTIETKPAIVTVDISEFLKQPFPPRDLMMIPFLPMQGLVMIYAVRGLGKTWFTLGIAYAVATGGSFLTFKATQPRKVLVIDGEMPGVVLQERLSQIIASSEAEAAPGWLRIITPDLQPAGMPDLSRPEGQELIAEAVAEADLVIVDNLSTLCRSGRENEAESWLPVQEWALNLRRQGKSVLFVHHANKNGGQRGSIRKEDVLDTVIALRKPQDYDPEDGARFEIHFEKHRGFYGEDAMPLEAHLRVDGEQKAYWHCKTLQDTRLERVVELHQDGMNQRDIASELSIGVGTVNRDLKAARERGLL